MSTETDGVLATPDTIARVATGYMAARSLFAASRVHLFDALSEGPLDAAAIAGKTAISPDMARILADSMAAVGLLTRDKGSYALTAESATYLGADAELSLGGWLAFLSELSYPHWLKFDRTVDTGEDGDLFGALTEGTMATFMGGVMNYNALHALMLAHSFDFTPYSKLLDFGGLSSRFAINALTQAPGLSATLVYDPGMADSVRADIAAAGLAGRASVEAGETASAAPDGEYDLVLVGHVIHRFGVEQNRAILARMRRAASEGATLLLLDFFLDGDARQRELDALHAGEYRVVDGTIVYPREEVDAWLADTGWEVRETIALPGSPRVLVATAH